MSRRPSNLIFLLSLLGNYFCNQGCVAQEESLPEIDLLQIGGFMGDDEFEFCYEALNLADRDKNLQVNEQEYVDFARLMSPPGVLTGVREFEDLPVALKAAFLGTACLCQDPTFGGDASATECCVGDNAHIRIPVTPPGEEISLEDKVYLYAACSYTSLAIDHLLSPSQAPSSSPAFPTPVTAAPTPASAPTTPSLNVTAAPATAPTTTPISTISPAPTPVQENSVVAEVTYQIAVANGKSLASNSLFVASYRADLIRAMNDLAPQIVSEVFGARRQRRKLRRLSVAFQWPSAVENLTNIECPSGTGADDLCQDVLATVTLTLVDESNPDQIVSEYEAALYQAIGEGRLQAELNSANPESPVSILSATSEPKEPETGLSGGAIAGIVIGVLAVVFIPLGVYVSRKQPPPTDEKPKYEPCEKDRSSELDHEEPSDGKASVQPSIEDADMYLDATGSKAGAAFAPAVASGAILGATQADYGRASRKAVEAMAAGEDIVAEPEMDIEPDNSSNAGSSGWSSSAGISSLNTGSIDDSMDAAAAAGATLAAIGATSALTRKGEEKSEAKSSLNVTLSDHMSSEEASRTKLDSLIEAGDWAAVGATAALLAAASDSQSHTSKSQVSARSAGRSYADSMDAVRAAELDNLVDAGDWEGVVLAAAKFEAAESSVAESRSTVDSLGSTTQESGTATGTAGSRSGSTSVSETLSKTQRRAEMRAEVEALVRRVVPEEIDNVDEMMTQFKGREEELIETLRTMQERSVAQKARSAGQKAAKTEARRSVQRGVVPGTEGAAERTEDEGTGAVAAVSLAAGSLAAAGAVASLTRPQEQEEEQRTAGDSLSQRRSALELAIESGDWEAVGEAAAMMSDASVNTTSTGEIDRLGAASSASSSVSSRRTRSLQGDELERAQELDELIEKGDWTGVVEATNRFKELDKSKQGKRSKEEEEALAQAEKWMKIAAQKKAEGADDAGASDAAEWAIQRSLSQMKQAEKKQKQQQEQQDKAGDGEEDEV